jgi:hypothetical protein
MLRGIESALQPSPTVKGHITAGALVGTMPTQKCWNSPVTTRPLQRAQHKTREALAERDAGVANKALNTSR